MRKLIVSMESEALTLCQKFKPKESLLFVRPSGRPIAVWVVSGNGDSELFCLTLNKQKLKLIHSEYVETYHKNKINEKFAMRAMGMNP